MTSKLMYALYLLDEVERSAHQHSVLGQISPRARVLVTLIYLVTMLSMPLERLSELMLFGIYPILTAAMGGVRYWGIMRRSLMIVPIVALIALPNIFYQREAIFFVGDIIITRGWITFLSIIVRGVLSLQAIMVLIATTTIYQICYALQRMGLPSLLASQIYMTMRYIRLLIEQALAMQRARAARGFGKKSYPLGMWATFIGQLLLRSIRRAENIGYAMEARGFHSQLPHIQLSQKEHWRGRDIFYISAWSLTLILLRILHFAERIF